MAYSPTNWADGVTPVDEAHLDKIEAGIVTADANATTAVTALPNKENKSEKGAASGYAPLDATTKVPLAYLPPVGADLSFDGDWVAGTYQDGDVVVKDGVSFMCVGGPTAVPPDPTLWGTPAFGWVPLDGAIAAAARILANKLLLADAQPVFRIMGDGKIQWGAGGATAPDTSLYRWTASYLRTAGHFVVDGETYLAYANLGSGKVWIGFPLDTSLYRNVAGQIGTESIFFPQNLVLAPIWTNQPAGSRVLRNMLLASDAAAAFNLYGSGKMEWGAGASNPTDTNLYRAAAGVLKTDGAIATGGYGTVFPSSPVDGQEFTLVNSTTPSFTWRFRYNAGSAGNKWEFVGGAPFAMSSIPSESTTSTGYVDLSTVLSFAIPRGGTYIIRVSGMMTNSGGPGVLAGAGIGIDGSVSWEALVTAANSGYAPYAVTAQTQLSAGQVVASKHRSGGPSCSFLYRHFEVIPVRLA